MSPRVLIVFGTTQGQTRKIAEAIGRTVERRGGRADVIEARRGAPGLDPASYDAVIVAASVHAGGYQAAVRRWVHRYAAVVQGKPNAFVSVCLGVLEHNPRTDAALQEIITTFVRQTGWTPACTKIVAGALAYSQYGWLQRWVMRRIAAKAGGDTDTSRDYEYTDWDDVARFASGFFDELSAPPLRHAG